MTTTPEIERLRGIGSELDIDETETVICPFCERDYLVQGSPSHVWTPSKSCSVTRSNTGILYKCFRDSCEDGSGFVPADALSFQYSVDQNNKKKIKKKKKKGFTRQLKDLSYELYQWLEDSYELTREEADINGFQHDYTAYRLYMPLMDENNYIYGAVSKCLNKPTNKSIPKTINYYFSEKRPGLHFPVTHHHGGGVIVLVEDALSAIKVARHAKSASLCGTTLSLDAVSYLQRLGIHTLILMLDADTWEKTKPTSIEIMKKYSLFFRNIIPVRVVRDPKDTPDEELKEILEGYCSI